MTLNLAKTLNVDNGAEVELSQISGLALSQISGFALSQISGLALSQISGFELATLSRLPHSVAKCAGNGDVGSAC